ncbi:MAG: hypothetical protein NZZ41_02515 [Candidatus Dojkabacteria bacterium]|nr:hypothetical protein [Candidatus Dojkabacteria bacterium]
MLLFINMQKFIMKLLVVFVTSLYFFCASFVYQYLDKSILVYANTNNSSGKNFLCILFPFLNNASFGINAVCSGDANAAVNEVAGLIRFLLSLIFLGIIISSVVVVVKASLTYIQSEGDNNKVAQAKKAIQNVFVGLAALFVGVIGIIVVLAFFGATGALNLSTNSAPKVIQNFLKSIEGNNN